MKLAFELELTDDQLRAIGHVTAQWAFMESRIDEFCSYGVDKEKLRGDELSFKKRLRIYRETLQNMEDKEMAAKLLDIVSRAGSLMDKRHKAIHSNWGRTGPAIDDPNIIQQHGVRGGKRYAQFISAEKLEELACQISHITGDLFDAVWPEDELVCPWPRK